LRKEKVLPTLPPPPLQISKQSSGKAGEGRLHVKRCFHMQQMSVGETALALATPSFRDHCKTFFGHKFRLGREMPRSGAFCGFFSRRRYAMCNMF
jgi:hypothetical protein